MLMCTIGTDSLPTYSVTLPALGKPDCLFVLPAGGVLSFLCLNPGVRHGAQSLIPGRDNGNYRADLLST